MERVQLVPTVGMPCALSQHCVSALLCIIHGVLDKLMVFWSERRDFWQTTPSSVKSILIFANIEANGGGVFEGFQSILAKCIVEYYCNCSEMEARGCFRNDVPDPWRHLTHGACAKRMVAHRENNRKYVLLDQAFCAALLSLQYLEHEPVWIVGLAKTKMTHWRGVTHLQFEIQSLFSRSPNQHCYKKLTAHTWQSCWCLVLSTGGDWAGSEEVLDQHRGALGLCPRHGSEGLQSGLGISGADSNEWRKLQALGKRIITYESLNPLLFCCYQLTGLFP